MNKTKKIKKTLLYIFLIWIAWTALWYPISLLFEGHPHFPSALLSPIIGFIAIYYSIFYKNTEHYSAWQSPVFWDITLPWMIYWSALFCIILIFWYYRKKN